MANDQGPRFSTRLWSEEVGLADAGLPPSGDLAYRFSSGRTFGAIQYDPPVPPVVPPPADVAVTAAQAQAAAAQASAALVTLLRVATKQPTTQQVFAAAVSLVDGTIEASQAQAVSASAAAVDLIPDAGDVIARAKQAQHTAAQAAQASLLTAATKQGQRATAAIGTAAQFTTTVAQGQLASATLATAANSSASTKQGQSNAASASVTTVVPPAGDVIVRAKQAQKASATATPQSPLAGTTAQGQRASAAATVTSRLAASTAEAQRAAATLSTTPHSRVAAATKQAQRSSANAASDPVSNTTISYTSSAADIANPDRGWTVGVYDNQTSTYYANLRNSADRITFVRQLVDLSAFRASAISSTFLSQLVTRFNAMRAGGAKCSLRFMYDNSANGDDAPASRVLQHIDQLTPFIQQFADVISVWEAGFVGGWGEWAYSKNYGNTDGSTAGYGLTAQQWADRKSVVDAILAVLRTLPHYRCVTLRTPNFKRHLYGNAALADGERFTDIDRARIGYYNDAFSTNASDMGTYIDRATEYPYVAQDTRWLPYGGEPEYSGDAASQCTNAAADMAALHMSYCGSTYNMSAINLWKSGGCYPNMTKKLGYRLRLTSATLPTRAVSAGPLTVTLALANDGFAAPMTYHPAKLVLRHTATGNVTRVPLAADCRDWLPGTRTVTETVTLPTLASGTYEVLLALEDESATLAGNALFSIQLANTGLWESATGFNSLNHALAIDIAATTPAGPQYYVSPTTGNDANAGTSSAAPWKTLAKAAAAVTTPGSTIWLMDGTYVQGQVSWANSGTQALPITIRAVNKWAAVISSTSGCNPAFSINASWITVRDLWFKTDPTNITCASYSSANADIRAWEQTTPHLGGTTSTGFVGFTADGIKSTSTNATRGLAIKSNQDYSLIQNCDVMNQIESFNNRGSVIRNNVIRGQDQYGGSILVKGGARDTLVYGNLIYNTSSYDGAYAILLGGDTAAQYVFDTAAMKEAYNCAAFDNIIVDNSPNRRAILGIWGGQDCAFFNNTGVNTCINVRPSPSNGATSVNPKFLNNSFTGSGGSHLYGNTAAGLMNYAGTLTRNYNNFYSYNDAPAQANPVTGNPLLVNAASDWHLQAGSPCIDAGTAVAHTLYYGGTADAAFDYAGTARTTPWSVGAYQYTP